MYDIKPLELKWEKYNARKKKPYYIAIGISLLLLIIISLSFKYKNEISMHFDDNISLINNKKIILVDKAISDLAVKTEGIENSVKSTNKVQYNDNPMNADDVLIEVSDKPKIPIIRQNKEKPRKKVHLNIIQTTASSAYGEVEKRFKDSHELDDALFLASSYYADRRYKKAIYWSLEVNKLNGNIEESWLIFANSKVKIGHKNEAIRILTSYITKSNSEEAKALLKKLKT